MTSTRIKTKEVRAAYKTIGFKPTRGQWFDGDDKCCPQVAITKAGGGRRTDTYVDRKYGARYAEGFRHGYDGAPRSRTGNERYQLGFLDGRRVARALGYTVKPLKKAS